MGRMAAVPDRNVLLLAGDVLGVSQLIETINHDRRGQSVGFALIGPFLRADARRPVPPPIRLYSEARLAAAKSPHSGLGGMKSTPERA
jgi:hypothetical protein